MAKMSFPGPDSIQRFMLPNGGTLLFMENYSTEFVVVEGTIHSGSLADPPGKAGLADLTAAMLMRGNEALSFNGMYDALEAVGASLSFDAGRHMSDFGGKCLAEDFGLLLSLMGDALCKPTFPEDQLELVRGEYLTGLQIQANDTRRRAGRAFRELVFGEHPYAQSIIGYPETISAITRDDLVAYHRDYYGPAGMVITVVGAVKAEEIIAKVSAALGNWQNEHQKSMPELPSAERPEQLKRTYVAIPDKTQADIVLGLPGPLRSAPDFLDASLANTILGVFGMSGRLGKNVREEQGLAYYVYSSLSSSVGPAPWVAATGVSPENVEQAIESIRHEIRRIQDEPVSDEELADSIAYRAGSLPVSLETIGGLAGIIMDMEVMGLGLDYLQRFPTLISEITAPRVQAAARKYFSADQIAIAVAGPPLEES